MNKKETLMNQVLSSRLKKINIVMLILLIAIFAYRLVLLDKVSTAGNEYLERYNTLLSLQKENEKLKNEYYTLTSMKYIKNKATKLGYVNRNISYLKDEKLASSEVAN